VRVALAHVPWPLPEHPRTRDELQLARTMSGFRMVRARPGEIVVRRGDSKIVFRQVEPHHAAVLFRRGKLDVAPVPLGDIRAALRDGMVQHAVRFTRLGAVDTLVFLHASAPIRRALSQTADRRDYALLVPEDPTAAAPSPPARLFRAARRSIAKLSLVRISVEHDPALRYGASLLVASWRDLGLDVRIVKENANAHFTRLASPGPASVPIARAVDARFVSPRARGWYEDARGLVNYSRVTVR
jgi:hypothetical protein